MLHAVIGIGSNSTRLLIGEVELGNVTYKRRMREGTRLFSGLDETGILSPQSMLRTVDAVARFVAEARAQGAEAVHVFATSAARDAANQQEFAEMVEAVAGVSLEILTGEQEACYSFLAGTGGARGAVVDIGGGSTEIAFGGGNVPLTSASAQLGAVRLLGEKPILARDGFDEALAIAKERAAGAWEKINAPKRPDAWFGVGGTMTCLASLDMQLPSFDREAVDGHALRREGVENWARRLAGMPAEERAKLPGMLAQRADIIAHGAIALLGVMKAADIPRIIVSNKTNLDGYLTALAEKQSPVNSVETVRGFYDASVETEWARLERHFFEFEINKRYLDRYIQPGDRVLDAGGGPGRYSLHLAQRGAGVTLLDLSEANTLFAAQKASEMGLQLATICADARRIEEVTEGEYDAILLMGPLYHLLEEEDRIHTVNACLNRLKPGGVLFVAFISMIGGMIFAGRELPESILWEGEDVFYNKIIRQEDFAGPAFTHAFFIEPSHALPFMARFPLEKLHLVGSESVTAPFHDKISAQPQAVIDKWLEVALALSEREDLLCLSEHLLYIGRKKGESGT